MRIGSKIKKIRELKNLSQSEIAEKLHISQRAYSNLENDLTKIDLERLKKLAIIFEVSLIDLLQKDIPSKKIDEIKIPTLFEHERNAYLREIQHLKEEIKFLRKLIEKKLN